jgi:glucose-6-phosphate isomerase
MIHVSVAGRAAEAADRLVPGLVADNVPTRLAEGDVTLWGADAEPEASIRLGWVHAASHANELVDEIVVLRDEFRARGLTRIVLCGMGGSSLAPEVIARTAGVALVVLDSTHPEQVSRVVDTDLEKTVVVIASKSGSTVETDSHKRTFEQAFTERGIDPASRIVIVTDPNSPLDSSAREAGYRVFSADPLVGGRYSALTAFGLVPSGLAGVDLVGLLDSARQVEEALLTDSPTNPALILAAAMVGTEPRRDKLGIVSAKSSIVGIGDWIEQLVAESTGKNETGVLPIVLEPRASDLSAPDLLAAHIVDNATTAVGDEVTVAGGLGAQLLLWEVATVVAGRLLGINPFDQPDVESAKVASRAFLDTTPPAQTPFAVDGSSELSALGYDPHATTVVEAVRELLDQCEPDGYVSIHGYADRDAGSNLESLRDVFAVASGGRPTTFGWGPRFLHSTGQYHKGGPRQGVFIQFVQRPVSDREIPGRPFTFGELLIAQARGDATVLAQHERPVLTISVDGRDGLVSVIAAVRKLGNAL